MSSLEKLREEFHIAVEALKTIHTRDELKAQMKKIERMRKELWETDSDFRHMIRERQRNRKMSSNDIMAPHLAKVDKARKEADEAQRRAEIMKKGTGWQR